MLIDLHQSRADLAGRTWDVAVFGGGPAGITVARELAAGGKSVLLCEAGGFEYSNRSQALYDGTESGLPTYNMALKATRLRYFGGTSNHWTGMCGVLDAVDFAGDRARPMPGWPIRREEIHAHLAEAAGILDLPHTRFDTPPLARNNEKFVRRTVAMSTPPTRFGTKYRDDLTRSPRIALAIEANLVDLRLAEGARDGMLPRVETAIVRNYAREDVAVRARHFVLAMGAVENARLLLLANRQQSTGLGNQADMVGRCYMEHLNVQLGRFVAASGAPFDDGAFLVSPTERLVREQRLASGVLSMQANPTIKDYGRLAPLRRVVREAACSHDTLREFARQFQDFNCDGEGIVNTQLEQAPNRDSRVTLGKDLDALGLRRSHLHWVLDDADRRNARTLALELARALAESNLARMKLADFVTDPKAPMEVWYHAHQMGTTRMSVRPADGVVDTDCRLHGVGNVYMAGASVFPTGGGINPTLTLVMLALRLGRHLRSQV